jgi:hypothetical protein
MLYFGQYKLEKCLKQHIKYKNNQLIINKKNLVGLSRFFD